MFNYILMKQTWEMLKTKGLFDGFAFYEEWEKRNDKKEDENKKDDKQNEDGKQ